ncbi:hypothetical protein AWC38_SpisGene23097, partial [Stylophora pistillata]
HQHCTDEAQKAVTLPNQTCDFELQGYTGHEARQCPHPMPCCICQEPGHLGANCDYCWVFPTVHGAPTDESEIINIEDEPQHSPSTDVNIEDDRQDSLSTDENPPLASVLPPPAQTAEQPIHPSPEQPVSDLIAQPLPDEQPNELNQPDLPSEQPDLPSEQPGQSSESTPTDSPFVTSQGFIATIKSATKPPSHRTPANYPTNFLLHAPENLLRQHLSPENPVLLSLYLPHHSPPYWSPLTTQKKRWKLVTN